MRQAIEFINRQKELGIIKNSILSPETYLIYIQGSGGIGKTRLLHEIPAFLKRQNIPNICLDVIDFDDLSLHFPDNFIHFLLERIPSVEEADKKYVYDELDELHRVELINDSHETQTKQQFRLIKALTSILNKVSKQVPIIMRFDTIEKMPTDIRTVMLMLARELQRGNLVFTGRYDNNQKKWKNLLKDMDIGESKFIDLAPFNENACQKYLKEKERQLQISLSEYNKNETIRLSNGSPILIDLAVEYFAKVPEFKLERLSHETEKAFFERRLVQYVQSIRGNMERLVLLLSRVYPLNLEMMAKALRLKNKDAQQLFEDALLEAFIKPIRLQNDEIVITLHDEMRNLIIKYVWDAIDPTLYRRQKDSCVAKDIFRGEDNRFRDEKRVIEKKEYLTQDDKIQQMILRRYREVSTETWVMHGLYCDFETGFEEWVNLVDKIRSEGRKYSFVFKLCQYVKEYFSDNAPYVVNITDNKKNQFFFRDARANQDLGNYEIAEKEYYDLLKHFPEQRRQIYNMLGVLKRDQGHLEDAIEWQKKSLSLVDKTDYKIISMIENQIGYLYRLYKDTDPDSSQDAKEHYNKALKAALKYHEELTAEMLDEKNIILSHIASIKNNLGYIQGLKRNYEVAELLCKEAIDVWKKVGREREIAWAKINLGVMARDQRQYQQSAQRLQEAIDVLDKDDDYRELCQAYLQLGWTQWFMGAINSDLEERIALLNQAQHSLEKARNTAINSGYRQELPDIYHQLASVYWYLGIQTGNPELKEMARNTNLKAIEFSKELSNHRYFVDAVLGEMEFDYEDGIDKNIEMHLEMLEPHIGDKYPLYFGRLHRILGDWAYKEYDLVKAVSEYALAFSLINKHGGYGPYAIEIELERLAQKIRSLPSFDEVNKFLGYLREFWSQDDIRKQKQHLDLLFWLDQQEEQLELLGIGN